MAKPTIEQSEPTELAMLGDACRRVSLMKRGLALLIRSRIATAM
jgi:hypothetical protein